MSSTPPNHRRLFFALMPSQELISRLSTLSLDIVADAGGRVVNEDSLHVTLAFLGDVPQTQIPTLAQIANGLQGNYSPVDIAFTDIEYWANVRIASLVSASPPPGLMHFARSLHTELEARGLLGHTFKYRPHVSLVKDAEPVRMPQLQQPIPWRADRFVLAERASRGSAGENQVLESWGFGDEAMQPRLFGR